MTTKLFFGNLDWNAEKEEVHSHFAPFGEIIEVIIAVDKDSGRSRGFGFVTYANEESVNAAIENLDNIEFKGRRLGVKVADSNRERTQRHNGNGDNGFNHNGYKNNGNSHNNFNNNHRNGGSNNDRWENSGSSDFCNRKGYNPRYQKRNQC